MTTTPASDLASRARQRVGEVVRVSADAARALIQRPMHTLAMIAGVMLAVASATAGVVVADTQQARIDLRFDLQRSDHVVIQADDLPPAGFPAQQLRRLVALEPVTAAGELSIWDHSARVSRSIPDTPVTSNVVVADVGGLAAAGVLGRSGAPLELISATSGAPVAWIGDRLAARLGVAPATGSPGAGQDAQILVDGTPLSVAGVVSAPSAFGYLSGAVVVSRATAVEHVSGAGENMRVVAQVRPGAAKAVGGYATQALDPQGDAGLRDLTPPDGEILKSNVASDLRRIGMALAVVIGLVGMLTAANTLIMSVYQRRRELGLRSAMGWSRRKIGALLLAESALAGLLAGVLGVGLGFAGAAIWCEVQDWELIIEPLLPVVVLAGGVLASLVGGLLPALKAASISPLTAMRS
ncbi:MAG: ABC transporter permease [Nocardioidaceae bacterium]|nr:ABC transporter permease [Nocardioidaceae bacterium]